MKTILTSTIGIVGLLWGFSASAELLPNELSGPFQEPDKVSVNGVEWAQLDIFDGISWNEINAVCPQSAGGACNGVLEDKQLTGWVWASVDDVNGLFNYFLSGAGISGPDLLEGPDFFFGEHLSAWAADFYDAGFRESPGVASLSQFIVGPLRTLDPDDTPRIALLDDDQNFGRDQVRTDFLLYSREDEYQGGWFFRSRQIPVSSTAYLIFAGFMGLVFSRIR